MHARCMDVIWHALTNTLQHQIRMKLYNDQSESGLAVEEKSLTMPKLSD